MLHQFLVWFCTVARGQTGQTCWSWDHKPEVSLRPSFAFKSGKQWSAEDFQMAYSGVTHVCLCESGKRQFFLKTWGCSDNCQVHRKQTSDQNSGRDWKVRKLRLSVELAGCLKYPGGLSKVWLVTVELWRLALSSHCPSSSYFSKNIWSCLCWCEYRWVPLHPNML